MRSPEAGWLGGGGNEGLTDQTPQFLHPSDSGFVLTYMIFLILRGSRTAFQSLEPMRWKGTKFQKLTTALLQVCAPGEEKMFSIKAGGHPFPSSSPPRENRGERGVTAGVRGKQLREQTQRMEPGLLAKAGMHSRVWTEDPGTWQAPSKYLR